MSDTLRIGVVGFGYWGPNLVRNIARADSAELVVACDLSESNLAKFAGLYPDVATTSDIDDMLGSYDLDGVVLATSAPTHHALAKRVIEGGLHCFVEKPLTLTSADAEELVRMADDAGVVLMVGHLMEYHSAVEWTRDFLADGGIGDVLYLYAQRLNLGKVRTEENAFWSLAPHDVSVALFLLGEVPDRVTATGADYLQNGIEDVVFANLHFPSGKTANIHVSWLDPHKVRKFTIVGSEKMLVFDDMQGAEKVWIYDRGVVPKEAMAYGQDIDLRFGDITVPYITMREPLAREVDHFLDCIRTGATPRSDGRDGLAVVRVLEAVDESMAADGAPVDIRLEV